MLNHKEDDDDQPAAAAYSIEPVHSDQADGRSYECTYCKHGFTNAQALGGHMNVHRKERAKNRFDHQYSSTSYNYNKSSGDPCLITSKLQADQMKTREFMMLRSSPMMYDHHSNLLSEYQNPNYYGSIAAGTSDQEEMRLSLNLSLNLEFIGRSHEEESVDREGNEDVELDLELRLGQDP